MKLRNHKGTIFVFITLFAFGFSNFYGGYTLNTLFPGFPIHPFGFLTAVLLSFVIMARFLFFTLKSKGKEKTKDTVICIALFTIFIFGPIPRGIDGAEKRIRQYGESEFADLKAEMLALRSKYPQSNDYMPLNRDNYAAYLEEVKELHEIFQISSFPLDSSTTEDYVSLAWSSGLVGGYEIYIVEPGRLPSWLATSDHRKVYDSVYLLSAP